MVMAAKNQSASVSAVAQSRLAADLHYLSAPHRSGDLLPTHVAYENGTQNPLIAAIISVNLPKKLRSPFDLNLVAQQDVVRRDLITTLHVVHRELHGTPELSRRIDGLRSAASDQLISLTQSIVLELHRNVLASAKYAFTQMRQHLEKGVWGSAADDEKQLAQSFTQAEQELTQALAQFDAGDSPSAFHRYTQTMQSNKNNFEIFDRATSLDFGLKFGTSVGVMFAAGLGAAFTGGVTLYAATGSATVTATTGIGAYTASLLAGGIAFTAGEMVLNHQLFDSAYYTPLEFTEKTLKISAFIGYMRGFMQVFQAPVYTGGAARAVNFSSHFFIEGTGMVSFNVATEGTDAMAAESLAQSAAMLAGFKVGHASMAITGRGLAATRRFMVDRFPNRMVGTPGLLMVLPILAGNPSIDEVPELLNHAEALIKRNNVFTNRDNILQALTGSFKTLETATVEEGYLLRAISLAMRAGTNMGDSTFFELANSGIERLRNESLRGAVRAIVEGKAAKVRALQVPETLYTQLQAAIKTGNEVVVEEITDRATTQLFSACRQLLKRWGDHEKVMAWYYLQMERFQMAVRQVAVSPDQRRTVHDINSLLTVTYNSISLASYRGVDAFRDYLNFESLTGVPRNLSDILQRIQSRRKADASIQLFGFDKATLVDTVDGRQLLIVLRNLVNNAVQHKKAERDRAEIDIRLTVGPGGNLITVKDEGKGMSADIAANLLRKVPTHDGVPVNHDNPTEFHGFGWLRIHEACEQLGIVPEIHSISGGGTTVTLKLPNGLLKADVVK